MRKIEEMGKDTRYCHGLYVSFDIVEKKNKKKKTMKNYLYFEITFLTAELCFLTMIWRIK